MTGICGHRRSLMTAAILAVSGALAVSGSLALSGCAPDLVRVAPARAADALPTPDPPEMPCSGAAAGQPLAEFFVDLDTGKSNLVPRYLERQQQVSSAMA